MSEVEKSLEDKQPAPLFLFFAQPVERIDNLDAIVIAGSIVVEGYDNFFVIIFDAVRRFYFSVKVSQAVMSAVT